MHALTFVLLALPLQVADREDVGAPEPPLFCDITDVADRDTVAEVLTAPVGGRWWLPREGEGGVSLVTGSGPFSIVDGSGDELAVDDVHLTPAALSLAVPSTVAAGEVLRLLDNGGAVAGVLLRVAGGELEGSPTTFSVDTVDVVGTVPEGCELSCRFEGMTVAAAPLLRLRYTGGPAILDAWAVMEGDRADELTPRTVDSRLLDANDDPALETELRLNELGFTVGLDVRVRALDLHSLETLYDEVHIVAPLAEVPAEAVADVPPCDSSFSPDPIPPFGCAAGGTPEEAAPLLCALVLLGALRRRRQ